MPKNIKFLLGVMSPAAILVVWVLYILYQINTGIFIRVRVSGYDPIDFLSGRYIVYKIDWENTDCTQFVRNICPKQQFTQYGQNIGRFFVADYKAADIEKKINGNNSVSEVVFSYKPNRQPYAVALIVEGKILGRGIGFSNHNFE